MQVVGTPIALAENMRQYIVSRLCFVVCLIASPSFALANEKRTNTVSSEALRQYSFGMRVGGYGFRDPKADAANRWQDCRMNGLGVFVHQQFTRHLFVEGGTDVYFTDSLLAGESDHPDNMDRISGLFTGAAGLKMYPIDRVTAYAQLGVGVELTKVRMSQPEVDMEPHDHDHGHAQTGTQHAGDVTGEFMLPMAFVGFGADVRVGQRIHVGAAVRTYVMGHVDHHQADELTTEPELAAQGQFYVRYDL